MTAVSSVDRNEVLVIVVFVFLRHRFSETEQDEFEPFLGTMVVNCAGMFLPLMSYKTNTSAIVMWKATGGTKTASLFSLHV